MTDLIVITGPPGAGKSTVARVVADRFEPSVLVEGDAFFAFLARGAIDPWLRESHEQNEVVTRAAASAAGEYTHGGYTTVYDGVVGPWFLATFIAESGLNALHYLVLMPSVERCVDRVKAREGHGFTDETATRKMHREFARADIDRRHLMIEPPDDVEAVADRIVHAVDSATLLYSIHPS
jgi:cytidylate kinase